MADIQLGEAGPLPQASSEGAIVSPPDEDLIDYDSDDASPTNAEVGKSSNDGTLAVNPSDEVALDPGSPVANGTATELATAINTSHLSEAIENDTVIGHVAMGQEGSHSVSGYDASHNSEGGEEEQADVHEIDYDHDDVDYHASDHDHDHSAMAINTNRPASHTEGIHDTTASGMPESEDQGGHFEIDWEEPDADVPKETSDGFATQSISEHQAMEPTESAGALEHNPSSAAEGSADEQDYDGTSINEPLVQGSFKSGGFPDIQVWYRGEEYPFFSQSSDGFFGHVSILDEPMGTILSELRSMLDDEIGDQDELVFQVDQLGLEFSESSPGAVLSTVTLHKVLNLMDSLAKNEDPESYSQLYTYLFTRPDTLKRLKFLQDSATIEKKSLGDVLYNFGTPVDRSPQGVDDLEELEHQQEGFGGNDINVEGVGELGEDFFGADESTTLQQFPPGMTRFDSEEEIENEGTIDGLATSGMTDAPPHDPNTTVDFEREQGSATSGRGGRATESNIEGLFEAPVNEASEGFSTTTQPSHLDEDLIQYTDDKIEAAGEDSIIDNEPPAHRSQDFQTGSRGLQEADVAASGDLVDTSVGNDDAAIQVNALRSEGDHVDDNDKHAGGNGNIDGMRHSTAPIAANALTAPGSVTPGTTDGANAEEGPHVGRLNAEARHIRSTSDISISFSEAGPEQVPLALADGASPALQIFNLDDAAASGVEPLETESEAAALLESEALNADLPINHDDLSEIDWAAEADDDTGGGVDEAQATAIKRSLPDDGADDGNDVKRRRSS
ncbi:hypothetical protein JDV02_007512 [Purpureocillium takamizusanense]|uniref:Uncharacterized protein n=1 Tax=Purpureocillium takamizusanense TaxID=2060973 RepID=A0A9Q8QN73_9HYPO|nr:uncharacterized protein JDV02_007512 [Purpureocillium takamizusanense]UNI21532.1 hypothetical protein JDV02_007512 [Purpureocillium takamizusanense]